MSKPEDNGAKNPGESKPVDQIKQDFLAILMDVENTLGESKALLGQLMVALEEMLGVVYQQNQNLKARYKTELEKALMHELSDIELGELAMTQVDLAIDKLNALNEKQKKLLKKMDTAKMTQLFTGDAKAVPAKQYAAGIVNVLDKNIAANQGMLQQVQKEKEQVKLALLHGKESGITASDKVAKFVDNLAKILDDKYKMIALQKQETQQLRQKMEKGEPLPQPQAKTTPKLRM